MSSQHLGEFEGLKRTVPDREYTKSTHTANKQVLLAIVPASLCCSFACTLHTHLEKLIIIVCYTELESSITADMCVVCRQAKFSPIIQNSSKSAYIAYLSYPQTDYQKRFCREGFTQEKKLANTLHVCSLP